MRKTIIKSVLVIIFLILILGFAMISDINITDIENTNNAEIDTRIEWENPFGFELTFMNIFWFIASVIIVMVLVTFIFIGIIRWRWTLVVLGTLLFCTILLMLVPDRELIPTADEGSGGNIEIKQFEDEMEKEEKEEWDNYHSTITSEDTEIPYIKDSKKQITKDKKKTIDAKFFIFLGASASFFILLSFFIKLIFEFRKKKKAELIINKETAERVSYKINITLDKLIEIKDPRQAIILAYSLFISELSNIKIYKALSDTPFEFAKKVLNAFKIPKEPIDTLISNFENARYSINEITEKERELVISSLQVIDEEIRTRYKLNEKRKINA